MNVLVVTGTGTGVGKTVVTAALAALAADRGNRVTVVKPAQTGLLPGELGDVDMVRDLSGITDAVEFVRYLAPLAPAAAARLSGTTTLDLTNTAARIASLAGDDRLVLVEGAGGLLVRYDDGGSTVADLARLLDAPVLVVAEAGLGTLNATALTLEALANRGLVLAGVVIGSWPAQPDLAARSNLTDFERLSSQPLAGAIPAGAGLLDRVGFLAAASAGLAPALGGRFDSRQFLSQHSVSQHSVSQHSVSQHSASQHSTGQHGTGRPETNNHRSEQSSDMNATSRVEARA